MSDIKLKELLSFILIHVSISFCLDMGNTGDKKNNWDSNFFSHAYLKYYVLSLVCIQITTFSVLVKNLAVFFEQANHDSYEF